MWDSEGNIHNVATHVGPVKLRYNVNFISGNQKGVIENLHINGMYVGKSFFFDI